MVAAPAPLIPSTAATRLPDGAALAGVNGPVIDGMQASPTVPSASVLQYGTYDRVGDDLVIHGPAGEQVVVENYFHGHTPATLHAPGGFELAGKTVLALAGEHAPVRLADAGGNQQLAQAASPIGTADKLTGTVTVTRVDGSVVTLQAGDVVYQGDVLQTADGSSIGLVMADGTELSLGSKGRIVLDEMVYDAGNGTGHSSVSLVSGVFSFVSGQIAKSSPDGMQIKTPVATIGIRGTSGTIQLGDLALDNDSQIRVILIPDPNGTVGEIQITTMDGRTSTLNTAFNGLNIGQSTLQNFTMTVHDFVGQYGSVIQNLRSDFSSSLGPINNTAPEQNNAPQNNTPTPGENKGSDASGTEKDSSQQASTSASTDSSQSSTDSSAPIKVVLTDTIVTKTTTSAFATTSDDETQTAGGSSSSASSSTSTGQSSSTTTSTSTFSSTDNSLNSTTSTTSGSSGSTTGSGSSGNGSSSVSYNGSVIDPHVSGATVFIDYDGDSILDSNEPNTVTASDGSYSLTDSLGIGGQVVSVGGVDTVTGLSIGTLTAPSGSSTVTPLTTLMQNLISSGAASSASQAQSLVASALGLNLSSIDLTNYDPVTQLSGSSATQASLILSTGVMVQNVVAMITATLVGAGASESSALEAAFTALATAMDGASGRSFLQDASAISSIISDAASDSSLSGTIDASKVAAAQTAVAQTISSLSAAMETIISSGGSATALLEDLSAAARVAQRDAQADIAAAVADGTAESLSNTYSSSSIASLIAQAKEEEVSTSGPIEGTSGNDSLTGTSGADDIQGNDGNDWLSGGAGNDRLYGGNGNDTLLGGSGNDLLNGGSGSDTADYGGSTAALTVNLATGSASSSEVGTDTLSSIEVVIGGSGDDTFTGGSGAETFAGGAGDDTFIASAGDDVLNGGDGTDTLDFSAVSAAVTVNLASGTASSTATGSDSLSSIEVVIGGSGDDTFTGGSGTETFFGGAGDDTFIVSAGDDVLNGGDGTDTLDFSAVSAAVTVDLASGTASSTATGSDSLSSIEVVIGGSGNDSFTGSSGAETFFGGAGDDTFIASAGDDVLNGGDGTDTVDYGNTKVALTVNLANGTASSSESGSDSLSSIEKVIGGSGNDSLTGSSGADTLLGGDGSDTLIGNGGADVLSGGSGNDTLTYTGSEVSLDGGDGSDRLLLNAGSSVALSSLVGVVSTIEIIDLGNHETTLTVTADDVSSLIGGSDWFIVDGGSSDVLALSGEWLSGDIITVDGVTYDSYVQDGTLILVGQDLTVEQIIPAVGEVLNVEGSSVLAGTYIHLGIGSDGYLGVGSGVVSETGWETASGGLSMAVDTDGFDQGDASATGDYFLPGTPVEGYSIGYVTTSGTTVLSAHYASSAAVNGSTSAEIDGTDLVATTTATSSDGALSISQVITLGSDATYYTTTVTLTNLTESTMSSVRYMRNADPDMDFDLHRTYLSVNDVLANPSDSGVAAVQASGPVSGDHVLYFSDSSSARASANGFENTNPYASNVYGSPSDPNGSSDDIGINMVIDGGTLAPGASVTISYVTSLNVASNGHDFLVGTSAANVLDGGNGNDILWGLGGADTLLGGNGSDTLIGGLGNDLLTGGNGPDTFLFTAGVGDTTAARIASLGTDVISDFTHGVDSLVLDGETFNLGEAFAYLEQGSSLSDTAVSFGTGSGVIVVGSDSGEGGVELWFTTDSSAATTSNSYQIATLQHADLSTVSQSDIHVG